MAGSVDDLRLELSEFESKVTSMEKSLQSVWSICFCTIIIIIIIIIIIYFEYVLFFQPKLRLFATYEVLPNIPEHFHTGCKPDNSMSSFTQHILSQSSSPNLTPATSRFLQVDIHLTMFHFHMSAHFGYKLCISFPLYDKMHFRLSKWKIAP